MTTPDPIPTALAAAELIERHRGAIERDLYPCDWRETVEPRDCPHAIRAVCDAYTEKCAELRQALERLAELEARGK